MGEIDLDFDDNLEADAAAFGQQTAQGDADQLSLPAEDVLQAKVGNLEEALYIAREVYGETNSVYSEQFCWWVQAVLEGGVDIKAAEEMLVFIHKDKANFDGRMGWKIYMGEPVSRVDRLRARRNATICAMNVTRAVLNKLRGQSYMLWVERALWRATEVEKDVKTER